MTKPEGLMEMVDRLDRELRSAGYSSKVHSGTCPTAILHGDEWPRLRDSILALREFAENESLYGDIGTIQRALELLARLDAPTTKEPRG